MTEAKRIAGNIIFLQPQSLVAKTPAMPFYFGVNTIGRRAECIIRIQQLSVSSNHAVLNVTSKSITISDMNSRNGVKINSEENRIAQNTEIAIDGGMIVYLGDVKCKFQRDDASESVEHTLPSRLDGKKNGKYEDIKNLLVLEDEEEEKDFQQTKKERLEMKSKQEMPDQFSISENFSVPDKKVGGKANSKKDTKNNSKIIIQEKQEVKEEKKVEKPAQEKKKQSKRESLERKNAKKNDDSDAPVVKSSKPEEKEKQKPKGGKESKQVAIKQADKKSLQKEEVKSNISKDKSEKSKAVKQKEKPKESKQPEKPKQRKTEKQQKKSKSLSKQASNEQQREHQLNKKERKKSLHLTIQETRQEQQPISEKRPSPSRKSGKPSDGEKTKRRIQNRKRLPSEVIASDQLLPARRSFMNKRIMASGFILNLNKKYFCAVETPDDGFDYLIMKEYKRTYKALFAISHGIPIIRYDWIRESQYFERTLKPENYYFKDLETIYRAIDKVKDGQRIFRGLEFFLGSDEYHLKVEDIEMLIYSCGGEICRKVGKLSPKEKESKNKTAIIRNKDATSTKAYEQQLKAIKKMGFDKAYTIELILNSCEMQAIDWSSNEVKLR